MQDSKDVIEGAISESPGGGEYVLRIGGRERRVRVLSMDARGIEFVMDQSYHRARYVSASTGQMDLVIDNVPLTLNMHTHLDDIVYKNSGGGGATGVQSALKSQIPGKVVSMGVSEGDQIAKGGTVCTLESMKMQVAVKAHKDGTVKSVRVKEGDTVAKGDPIADIE